MSLDVWLTAVQPTEVYSRNITHNLNKMAMEAGIYEPLWRPEEVGITHAHQLVEPLTVGLEKLKADPEHYQKFNSPNGWGMYEHFVPFVESYLEACKDNPDAEIGVSR
jgi:hypothetical protein